MTATLSDGDGGIEKLTWTWSYFGVSGTDSLRVTGPVASSGLSTTLTPKASVVGNRLRADASYDDDHGDGKQAQSAKTSAVKATTPTPPRSLSAAAGNRQVELTWKHPASHGGAPVTRYEYRSKGSGTWSGWSTSVGLARKKTVTGLTNGTAYSFQVRAVNSAGPGGVASASATPFKPDTAGSVSLSTTSPKVGKALTATLTDADGGIKNLTWSWSSFGTSPADTLRVTGPVASSGLTSTLTPGTTLVGHRLRANASYDDAHGTGKQAQSAKTSAVKASPPGAPRSLSSSGHYGQVTLSWQAPASSGGATITGYQGRWKSDGSFNSWRSLGAGTARSYTVTNLSGGTYTFEVRARNSAGPGAAASTSEVVPAARAKPAGLQALPDTVLAVLAAPNPFNAEITLHLQLPDEGPVHLTLYNMTGQRIRTLADGRRWEAGYHSLPWDGTDQQGRPATSGVYLFRLQAGAEVLVRKVVLIR